MTSRVLPPNEWHRLAGTELEALASDPNAPATVVVVEDDGGEIVACWGLVICGHAEGFWVAPSHRARAGVLRRLLVTMRKQAEACGLRAVWTTAMSPEVVRFLTHAQAVEVPGQQFAFAVAQPIAVQE
jgi:hypothetical protein